ncbi:MAG: hypothetical protein GX567_06300 [Clostridia bacterium]|nr:hypothetical protein [Clostridia bacterium]
MGYSREKSKQLYEELLHKGYATEFCDLISKQLSTEWTANRMIGYLRQAPKLKEEDVVDEMLAILDHREQIRQKKEMEFYQGRINELYEKGLDDEE